MEESRSGAAGPRVGKSVASKQLKYSHVKQVLSLHIYISLDLGRVALVRASALCEDSARTRLGKFQFCFPFPSLSFHPCADFVINVCAK